MYGNSLGGEQEGNLVGTGKVSTGTPTRLRSFDPVRIADLEYRAWVGYYLRRWPQVLRALIGLVRVGFGLDWYRTMHGAWLMLRASQLWAPYPDNHPKRALAYMRRFYALIRLAYGEPSNPAKAAELEVEWLARAPRDPARVRFHPGRAGRGADPALLLPLRRARGSDPASPRCTGPRRWTCPTGGSSRAASPIARCSRKNTRPWSAPTPPSSPLSITYPQWAVMAPRDGRPQSTPTRRQP